MVTAGAPVKFGTVKRGIGSQMRNNELSEDELLGGRIRVRQPRRGYRVNVDTILLAAAAEAAPGMRLMEAGCGVGAGVLAVAARAKETSLFGVEREPTHAALARENVALNGMEARIEIAEGDALDRAAAWGVFDGVFVNPPFDGAGEGRLPAEARRHAHVAEAPISLWVAGLADRLKGGAALTMIHRAAKLSEILAALEGRLGGAEILPIRPHRGAPAKRVLVRARKGSRAPLTLWAGLDLHPEHAEGAKHTPEIEAILRGEAPLRWG